MNKHQHIKVFIADDHPVVALGLKCLLSRNADIDVVDVGYVTTMRSTKRKRRINSRKQWMICTNVNWKTIEAIMSTMECR